MTMRVVSLLLLVLVSGSLQGCFPVVAVGVGAGVMMAQDRRTADAYIDDQKIESKAARLIDKQVNSVMHANVTSFNYRVLISGEVPDESTKTEIDKIVSGFEKQRWPDHLQRKAAVYEQQTLQCRSHQSCHRKWHGVSDGPCQPH